MPIQFRCQYCRQRLGIADSRAGTLVDCPACGRSLRVPSADGKVASGQPEQRAPDVELESALQQLTNFGSETSAIEPGTPVAESARIQPSSRSTLPVTATEIPLRAQPELLDDVITAEEGRAASTSAAVHAGIATDTAAVQLTSVLTELAAQQPSVPIPAETRRTGFRRYFPTLISLLTALLAFFAGMLIADHRSGGVPASSPSTAAEVPDTEADTVSRDQPQAAVTAPAADQVSGIVFAKMADGRTEPDAGALVIIAPAKNASEFRLDGRFLRDDKTTVAHKALVAALKEFEVSFTFAGADGSYSLPVPRQGSCTLIAVSKRIARAAASPLADDVAGSLAEWFTTPSPITGRLQAVTQSVASPGPGAGIRQDITIAAPAP